MLRKTLTIASLIGLVLSLAAWGLSYLSPQTHRTTPGWLLLYRGTVAYQTRVEQVPIVIEDDETQQSTLVPRTGCLPSIRTIASVHLWIPTIACGSFFMCLMAAGTVCSRRRRKLGQCVNCGYSLQGLTEPRCPECGTEIQA